MTAFTHFAQHGLTNASRSRTKEPGCLNYNFLYMISNYIYIPTDCTCRYCFSKFFYCNFDNVVTAVVLAFCKTLDVRTQIGLEQKNQVV